MITQTKAIRFRQPLNEAQKGNEILSSAKSIPDSAQSAKQEHEKWLRLYSEPDVWENPEKRDAMFKARWEYQNAVLSHLVLIAKTRTNA